MAKQPTAADILADEATVHAFTLLRVQAGMRQNALAVLSDLELELANKAEKYAGLATPQSREFAKLNEQVGKIISSAYTIIGDGEASDLDRIAASEKMFANATMNKIVGVNVFSKAINPKVLEGVSGPIIMGHSSRDYWEQQSANLRSKFSGEMAKGILLGEDNAALVRRIRGTKKNGYADGIMKATKREAEAIVRTSVQSVSNYARIESFKELRTAKGIAWLATLDSRTTLICISLDKKQWRFPDLEPIGHNKRFPGYTAHWNCRSTVTAVTYTWAELAGKPIPDLDGATLQDAVEQKLKDDGMSPDRIAAAMVRTRASMDGQVGASQNFEEWASTKSDEFVEQVVGPGRFALWNAGKITFSDLTNQSNRPLTIAALEQAIATGKLPAETLGVAFNPPPSSITAAGQLASVQAAAAKAAAKAKEEADAAAEVKVKQAQEQAAIQAQADKARADALEAEKAKLAQQAADRLAALELAQKEAAEIQAKADAALAAQKAAAEQAAAEKAQQLATMAKKYATGKPWTKAEQAFGQTLGKEEAAAYQEQIEAMKEANDAAKQAKAEAKAAKQAAKEAKEAAKAAAQAQTAKEANALATAAGRAEETAKLEGIPSPDELKVKLTLGGSTGAKLTTAPDGSQWVLKSGASPAHVREEQTADSVYRALGVKVPDGGLFETANGPQKVTKFLEGSQTLADAWTDTKRRPKIEAALREHFAADILLGNWDVIGMSKDNVLVTAKNEVYRIDNGGSLRFRAMGAPKKGQEWDEIPRELFDMRDPKKNPQTSAVFGKLTMQDIARQVEAWPKDFDTRLDALPMDDSLRDTIKARAKELRLIAARTLDLEADGWKPEYAEKLTRATWELRAQGVRDGLPPSLSSQQSSPTTLVDPQGRPFYGLRKPPTMNASGDAMGDAIKAAVMTINHKAINGGLPNAAKVNTALSFKGLLKAYEQSGDAESKAKAKEYLPWLEIIEKHGKSTKPPNVGMFTLFKTAAAPQTRTQSVVGDMWAAFQAKHGQAGAKALDRLMHWQSAQAANSWRPEAQVAKAWMQRQRAGGKWYTKGNAEHRASEKTIADNWASAVKAVGNEAILDDVFVYQHALTQELLDTTALPYSDRAARAVRLIRTESSETIAANGITPGKYGEITMVNGAVESHSLVQAYALYGALNHSTITATPFHRVLGAYLFERNPGHGGGAFAGQNENEFTADTSNLPKKYLNWNPAKYEGKGQQTAQEWDTPLSHLRPRP